MNHFERKYSRDQTGRFIILLPMKKRVTTLGESRSLEVKQFKVLELSLMVRSQSKEFADAVQEYFDMGHAELVPVADLGKPSNEVYYFPMHAVRKEANSTSKVRVVLKLRPAHH